MESNGQPVPDDLVVMAVITAGHGIKGWVKLKTFTDAEDALADFDTWWIRPPALTTARAVEVESFEVRPNVTVAKLVGIDSRTAADQLTGTEVLIAKSQLPELGDDEAYWMDLVGLQVVTPEGASLGVVDHLFETPAHPVLVVRDGDQERLIPAVDAIILEVDWARRVMTVDWQLDY